jgi:xylulokinase
VNEPLILAHDVGTSSTKSSVMAPDGRILASQSTPHATALPQPGWAEQNAEDWWRGVCRNTRALVAAAPEIAARIAGIGVSGHMLGCLALDRQGRPLRPSMLHSDTRAAAEAEAIARDVGADHVYRATGNRIDARSSLAKMCWLKTHDPATYKATHRFVQSKDFIVGRMTGSFDSTDYSDASHALWLDLARRDYAADLIAAAGLDVGKLPALHASVDVVGAVSEEGGAALGLPSGIPVVAGGGDGACASIGAGAVRENDTYCCIGTTAWIASVSPTPFLDERQRLFNIATLDGEAFGVYGTVQCAGRSLDWVMELLGESDFEQFDERLASVSAGSDGLIFLPYLEGERSPIWDADARGVFFGIAPSHGRAHFLRATVEGVSYALRSVLDVLRERSAVPQLRLIGGGGQSAGWRQLLADVCDVEIQVLSTQAADATSLGAAIAAGVGVGVFKDLADGVRMISVEQSCSPNAETQGVYDSRYALFRSLYVALKPQFKQLQETR